MSSSVAVSYSIEALPEHRKAVLEAIARCEMSPRIASLSSGQPITPVQAARKRIDDADIYLCIPTLAYGEIPSIDNPDTLSFTELEYRYARQQNKTILAFLMDEEHPLPAGATRAVAREFFESDAEKEAR
jgi:hypothetical protein